MVVGLALHCTSLGQVTLPVLVGSWFSAIFGWLVEADGGHSGDPEDAAARQDVGAGWGVLHWGEEWEDSCPCAPELKAQHVVCQGGS